MSPRRKTPLVAATATRPQREHYATTHSTAADVRRLVERVDSVLASVETMNRNLRNALDVVHVAARRDLIDARAPARSMSAVVDPVVVQLTDDTNAVLVALGGSRVELPPWQARQLAHDLTLGATTVESHQRAVASRDRCASDEHDDKAPGKGGA